MMSENCSANCRFLVIIPSISISILAKEPEKTEAGRYFGSLEQSMLSLFMSTLPSLPLTQDRFHLTECVESFGEAAKPRYCRWCELGTSDLSIEENLHVLGLLASLKYIKVICAMALH